MPSIITRNGEQIELVEEKSLIDLAEKFSDSIDQLKDSGVPVAISGIQAVRVPVYDEDREVGSELALKTTSKFVSGERLDRVESLNYDEEDEVLNRLTIYDSIRNYFRTGLKIGGLLLPRVIATKRFRHGVIQSEVDPSNPDTLHPKTILVDTQPVFMEATNRNVSNALEAVDHIETHVIESLNHPSRPKYKNHRFTDLNQ
jgi:hypothetical protein